MQPPLPPEGKKYRCNCGTVITISYPEQVRSELQARGLVVEGGASTAPVPEASLDREAEAPPPPRQPTEQPATPPPLAPPAAPAARPSPHAGLTPPPVVPPMPSRSAPKAYDFDETPTVRRDPIASAPLAAPAGLTPTDSLRMPPPMPPARPRSAAPAQAAPAPPLPDLSEDATIPAGAPVAGPGVQPLFADAPKRMPPPPPPKEPAPVAEADRPETVESLREPPAAKAKAKTKTKKTPKPKKVRSAARGGILNRIWGSRIVRWTTYAAALCILAGAITFFAVIHHFSQGLPSVDSLAVYEPPTVTTLRDTNGEFVGEFYEEQRYVVPFDEIPAVVRDAFVSAEDASFWEHAGLDFMGIARAALKNVQERRMAQGASTITQQVARSFLLTREKKLARKIKEAILSVRVERNFDKEHILYLYLNQIYLGHGAYGVQAAAHLYFDKDVQDLGVAEAAILAGLPQAPHTYSPNRNFKAAKDRQKYVLGQMARRGYITTEEADAAYLQDIVFSKKRDRNLDVAPFYIEHVRRYLVKKYGHDTVYNQGLQVTLPIDLELQRTANESVLAGVRRADKRIGYRGAIKKHEDATSKEKLGWAVDRERSYALRTYQPGFTLPKDQAVDSAVVPKLTEGEITRGLVTAVEKKWALVQVGAKLGVLPVEEFGWCHNVKPESNWKFFKCRTLDDMVYVDEEIAVRVVNEGETWDKTLPAEFKGRELPRLAMEQNPWPEAAMLSMRVTDGAVLAMVGGTDFTKSEFNRSIQAKRQVGSTFKPLVYAAALDHEDLNFTPSSILVDAPIVEEMSGKEGELWKPGNSGGEYLGDTTFRRGLVLSRNIVTLKVLERLGMKYTLEYMQRFGFETPLEENLAMGLGASALTMQEMIRAYSVFPTLGDRQEPYFISEVEDRHGNVLEATEAGERIEEVMDEETAYLMVDLMHSVVTGGTARKALQLKKRVAGKTGTTNGFKDAWFIGYTPEILTATWVGLDEFKSMGKGQYGGDVALPIWIDYMRVALEKYPPSEYELPKKVKMISIDSESGLLSREGEIGVKVAYKKGTEPTKFAPKAGQMDAADFLSGEF
jgi:penicillin-binding protein 1A